LKILLLSDTHGLIDPKIEGYLGSCDEVWHAGDIGDVRVSEKVREYKPLRAVFGNIDGREIRQLHPEDLVFDMDGLKILITHIGGSPGNYYPEARKKIELHRPSLFICGHSHILKVMRDPKYNFLYMNPGAAGKHGFHKIRTMLRFEINQGKIEHLEAIELGLRGTIE
jgi:uncharacterized protein